MSWRTLLTAHGIFYAISDSFSVYPVLPYMPAKCSDYLYLEDSIIYFSLGSSALILISFTQLLSAYGEALGVKICIIKKLLHAKKKSWINKTIKPHIKHLKWEKKIWTRLRFFLNSLYILHFLWYTLIILQSLHIWREEAEIISLNSNTILSFQNILNMGPRYLH